MKQAREMGIESTFIGSDGWDDPLMFDNIDAIPHLENSYYCTNFDPEVSVGVFQIVNGQTQSYKVVGTEQRSRLAEPSRYSVHETESALRRIFRSECSALYFFDI